MAAVLPVRSSRRAPRRAAATATMPGRACSQVARGFQVTRFLAPVRVPERRRGSSVGIHRRTRCSMSTGASGRARRSARRRAADPGHHGATRPGWPDGSCAALAGPNRAVRTGGRPATAARSGGFGATRAALPIGADVRLVSVTRSPEIDVTGPVPRPPLTYALMVRRRRRLTVRRHRRLTRRSAGRPDCHLALPDRPSRDQR
jgi:hypothetical protein